MQQNPPNAGVCARKTTQFSTAGCAHGAQVSKVKRRGLCMSVGMNSAVYMLTHVCMHANAPPPSPHQQLSLPRDHKRAVRTPQKKNNFRKLLPPPPWFNPTFSHLDHHFAPPEELVHLLRDLIVAGGGLVGVALPRLVLLELQVGHGSVDATDLPVRPPLHAVTAAQPLQSRHRYVHCLDKERDAKERERD